MNLYEINYYNRENVWALHNTRETEIIRTKKTIDLIPKDVNSVLDIGCGNGILTNMIEKPFVVGVDFAKIPLKKLLTNSIQGSIDSLPIKENKFDLIILTRSIRPFLMNRTYQKAIKEIKRIKSKYVIISVPYDEDFTNKFCKV